MPVGIRAIALPLASTLATTPLICFPALACAAETADLRAGVRTTFYGGGFGDFYGWAIAFGDVDGDGYTDFLSSSANSEGPNDEHPGHEKDVYLFFGRPRAEIDSVYAVDVPGVADIIFYKGGYALACADIDNDGYDDLILADDGRQSGTLENRVYVIFGAPRNQLRTVYNFLPTRPDYTPPDLTMVGYSLGGGKQEVQNFEFDFVTRSLATGDLNADGYADIVIGDYSVCADPGTCLDGAVYVVLGRPREDFPPVFDTRPQSGPPRPDITFLGDDAERYPVNLAIGDLDGDGIDDLLASTTRGWGELNITPQMGEIHGWWGRREWKASYDTQIDDFDFAIQGDPGSAGQNGNTSGFGFRMETGDFDGDGRDDLLVGLPFSGDGRGNVRLYFGRARALWPKWASALDMTDVLMVGADPGEMFQVNGPFEWGICQSLASGNRNGDRYDDILIGAGGKRFLMDQTIQFPGGAYWLRGRPRSEWEPLIDLRDEYDIVFQGAEATGSLGPYAFDRVGFMTGIADLDGNGLDEIFLAAPFGDGPGNIIPDCGEIYVVYDDEHVPTRASDGPPLARGVVLTNYPNPFASQTTFGIRAPAGAEIGLVVYDARGREVARPLAPATSSGAAEIRWTARDEFGRELPSGVYFAKLRAGRETDAKKIVLVR
jgi:hypothetical protein